MRPLIAAILGLAIIVTVHSFISASNTRLRQQARQTVQPSRQQAAGTYQIDVTLTFAAEPDAFATDSPLSLVVRLGQSSVLEVADPIEAGSLLKSDRIDSIVVGMNEFYLEAFPDENQFDSWSSVRLRILRDDTVVAEETLWSMPGEPVVGTLLLDVPADGADVDQH